MGLTSAIVNLSEQRARRLLDGPGAWSTAAPSHGQTHPVFALYWRQCLAELALIDQDPQLRVTQLIGYRQRDVIEDNRLVERLHPRFELFQICYLHLEVFERAVHVVLVFNVQKNDAQTRLRRSVTWRDSAPSS